MSRSRKRKRQEQGQREAQTLARRERRRRRLEGLEARPALREGEVYVTGGACFHTEWCPAVNGVWLSGGQSLVPQTLVVARARELEWCSLCREEVSSRRAP